MGNQKLCVPTPTFEVDIIVPASEVMEDIKVLNWGEFEITPVPVEWIDPLTPAPEVEYVIRNLVEFQTLEGKTVGVRQATFKIKTDDIRTQPTSEFTSSQGAMLKAQITNFVSFSNYKITIKELDKDAPTVKLDSLKYPTDFSINPEAQSMTTVVNCGMIYEGPSFVITNIKPIQNSFVNGRALPGSAVFVIPASNAIVTSYGQMCLCEKDKSVMTIVIFMTNTTPSVPVPFPCMAKISNCGQDIVS